VEKKANTKEKEPDKSKKLIQLPILQPICHVAYAKNNDIIPKNVAPNVLDMALFLVIRFPRNWIIRIKE